MNNEETAKTPGTSDTGDALPVSNEELVALIQAGARDRLGELWTQVERFVRWLADRWPVSGAVDHEDLYQAGYLALVRAVDTYDLEQGTRFTTYFTNALKTAFSEAQGRRSKRQRLDPIHQADSLDRPLDQEDAGGDTLGALVADPAAGVDDVEREIWLEQLHAALEEALDALPTEQSTTLRLRYYQDRTLDDVGRSTGVTREVARDRERKGLQTLKMTHLSKPLLQFVEDRTPYYARVGVAAFRSSGVSVVEKCVLKRERLLRHVKIQPEPSRSPSGKYP